MKTNKRSRGRLAVVALGAGVLVGLAHPPLWAGGKGPLSTQPAPAVHVVKPGETLWELAGLYASHEDPREYVYNVVQINHLGDGEIFTGERILLPAG